MTKVLQCLFYLKSFGTEHGVPCVYPDDHHAGNMKESGIRILEIGYEAPILWIVEHPDLPDNKGLAEKRLQSLVIRFAPEPDYEKKYRTAMEENFTEG